jgi:hypothetical protein
MRWAGHVARKGRRGMCYGFGGMLLPTCVLFFFFVKDRCKMFSLKTAHGVGAFARRQEET